jgi:pimeloyl-ACP methyl ester carboxylesterase
MTAESTSNWKADMPTALDEQPAIADTRRGPIEYAMNGSGRAVLALHGAMGGYDQGLILARTVGEIGFRFIAVSRPGYLSTPLTSGRTPEEQADLYASLLDVLDIPKAAVIAISGGGPSALHFALRHRTRCAALVLVSTCGGRIDTPVPLSFKLMKLLIRSPWVLAAIRKRAERNPERGARRSIPDPVVRARTLQDPEAGPLFTALLRSTADRMEQRLAGTENDIRVTRSTDYPLEEIAVPTLVVHGTADRMVPFAVHAKPLVARIPGSELLAIEGGEHVAIFTHRNEIRARIAEFLGTHSLEDTAISAGW